MNLGKRKKHVIRADRDKYIQTTLTSGFNRCSIPIKFFAFGDRTLKRVSI